MDVGLKNLSAGRVAKRVVGGLMLLLSLSFVSSGCTYLKELVGLGVQRPKVSLSRIEVTKAAFTKIDLLVHIRVDNPNNFVLRLSQLVYNVSAADLQIASGQHQEQLAIPAGNYAYVRLPITVDAENAVELAKRYLQSTDEIFCVVKAQAAFHSSVGAIEVNLEDKKPLSKFTGRH